MGWVETPFSGCQNAVGRRGPVVFAKLCWSFHAPPPAGMFCGGGSAGGGGRSTAKVCGDFFSYHFGENVTLVILYHYRICLYIMYLQYIISFFGSGEWFFGKIPSLKFLYFHVKLEIRHQRDSRIQLPNANFSTQEIHPVIRLTLVLTWLRSNCQVMNEAFAMYSHESF